MANKEILDKLSIYIPQRKMEEKPVERLIQLGEKRDRSINAATSLKHTRLAQARHVCFFFSSLDKRSNGSHVNMIGYERSETFNLCCIFRSEKRANSLDLQRRRIGIS